MSEKILIQFKASGDARLRASMIKLAASQALLEKNTKQFRKSLSDLTKGFETHQRRLRNTSGAFSTLRSQMLLFSFAMSLGGRQLTQFAKQAGLLAKQSGVAPNVVLKDIAQSSEAMAKFTDASGENIAKAAIMATKLGTNLNTVSGIMSGLLDFQSSLSAEMEASVLIGRQLNFQKARELALNNDIEGAMAEVVSQLGSEEEFTNLNSIQRDALAKSIGVGTDQLAKFITNQDKATTLAGAMAEQDTWEGLVGSDSLDAIAQVVNQFKVIGADLVTSIGPSMVGVAQSIANVVKGLNESKMIIPVLKGLFAAMLTKNIANAIASAATAYFVSAGTMGPLGLAAIAAAPIALAGIAGLITTMASAKQGGITSQEGLVNVHPQEAIVPISKLADFMADAMAPVVAAVDKLNEDFTNKHVPALATSNIEGAKKSSREIGRQFQINPGA